MAFGWKTVGNAINPSAVGPQNKNPEATYKKPQVYGLAALSQFGKLGRVVSATVTITNDDGTTETRAIETAQIDAMVSCGQQFGSLVDWYTLAIAAVGVLTGLISDSESTTALVPILATAVRHEAAPDGQCQGVRNAIIDVIAGFSAGQMTQFIRTGRSIWTGKKK
jgi:hypothetical protein